jgi:CheY-like chemotaxis protein
MASAPQFPLRDLRILVAEDEYLLAEDVARMLERQGAKVVGPVSTVTDSRRLARYAALDGAALDVNLRGDMVWSVADVLLGRRVPVVFMSGYGATCCPERYRHVRWLSKPLLASELVNVLMSERLRSLTS